jgi:hypothetical protein
MEILPAYIADATAGHSSNAIESPTINTREIGASSAVVVVVVAGIEVVARVVGAAATVVAGDGDVVTGVASVVDAN